MWARWWGGGGSAVGRRGRAWSLQELKAEWLPSPRHRHNLGISFRCPVHEGHRLTIRFVNPYDGEKSIDGPGILAYVVSNGMLSKLTLITPAGGDALDFNKQGFGECGRYRLYDGHLHRIRF